MKRDPKHIDYLLLVALTNGSVTRSQGGDVSMCWKNSTGARSSISGIVDLFDGSEKEASACVEWAKKHGILVVDYDGLPFDDVARWVIKGPMMREQFEQDDPEWLSQMFAGTGLTSIPPWDWCIQAHMACGVICHNVPVKP